ncbi:MAG TPA: DUF6504 family protein [Actinomycetota bacterium]|nr:DUF6504 family protein [Actinomycetota bacterium]
MTKRYDEPIEVEVSRLQPVAFSWRGRRYPVSRLLKYWREAGAGWDPERLRDHECFRVESEGGTYDLRHERRSSRVATSWRLLRVWD